MSEPLKSCPFCGGEAARLDLEDGDCVGGSVIVCTRCQASTAAHFDRKEHLYSSWNDRVTDRVTVSELEELAAAHSNYLHEGLHCFSTERLKEFSKHLAKVAVFRERKHLAEMARRHGTLVFGDCECLGFMDMETGARECSLENKGGDCLCQVAYEMAEEIARAIEAVH